MPLFTRLQHQEDKELFEAAHEAVYGVSPGSLPVEQPNPQQQAAADAMLAAEIAAMSARLAAEKADAANLAAAQDTSHAATVNAAAAHAATAALAAMQQPQPQEPVPPSPVHATADATRVSTAPACAPFRAKRVQQRT